MPYAIAFLGSLAFVGWVLWLRERRVETVRDVLESYGREYRAALLRFESATTAANLNADALQAAVNDVKGVKDGLSALQLHLGVVKRAKAPDPVFAMPQEQRK